jgi:glutamine amidotransferase
VLRVIDTGRGNLLSMLNALEHLGADPLVARDGSDLDDADRIVLPGVGAFRDSMERLLARDLVPALHQARAAGTPILGVCLGMQLLADGSTEGGESTGLGWVPGIVRPIPGRGVRIPHTGWNETELEPSCQLFKGLPARADFYYVHSFHLECREEGDQVATCDHGGRITSAVCRGNVAGVQFHPEKSQDHGLDILANFLRWNP